MQLHECFDKIYVLNLNRRKDRLERIKQTLLRFQIEYEVFGATDGYVIDKIWSSFNNPNFTTPNYLACAISHLSIYNDAQANGYDKILILEDDVVVNKHLNRLSEYLPEWTDVLYLGWIPLSDDQQMWTYQMANQFISPHSVIARNFWGMYAYGTTRKLREEILSEYKTNFPMELDRYFVNYLQPQGRCIGFTPQLFACQDIWSDNMSNMQYGMLQRSVDQRFAKLEDYS